MILKEGVRILTPQEYDALRDQAKQEHQIILDALLFTGARFIEINRIKNHPEWLNKERRVISVSYTHLTLPTKA